jgi:diacylglycerol O-acyltransferase / wax synthase
MATPRWTNDPDFDLSWHLRWVHLESWDEVLELARVAAMTAFDPAHPLWENTFVEGLPGGEAAAVLKLHHSLTDGVGGMQMALLLFDLEPDAAADDAGGPPPCPASPGPDRPGARRPFARLAPGPRAGPPGRRRRPPGRPAAVTHPVQTAGEVVDTARSVARMVAPVNDTRSPLMTERHLGRHVGTLDVPLAALHDAGASVGGTLNDAFLAGVTGGLRKLPRGPRDRGRGPAGDDAHQHPQGVRPHRREPDHPAALRGPGRGADVATRMRGAARGLLVGPGRSGRCR